MSRSSTPNPSLLVWGARLGKAFVIAIFVGWVCATGYVWARVLPEQLRLNLGDTAIVMGHITGFSKRLHDDYTGGTRLRWTDRDLQYTYQPPGGPVEHAWHEVSAETYDRAFPGEPSAVRYYVPDPRTNEPVSDPGIPWLRELGLVGATAVSAIIIYFLVVGLAGEWRERRKTARAAGD